MALLEVEKLSPYTAGFLYAHVVAVRFNTNEDADLVLVDYTYNSNLNDAVRYPFDVDLRMALQVKVSVALVRSMATAYRQRFNRDVFLPDEAELRELNWIPMGGAMCLVRAYVKILRRPTHLGGMVQRLELVGREHSDSAAFLRRIPDLPRRPLFGLWRAHFAPGAVEAPDTQQPDDSQKQQESDSRRDSPSERDAEKESDSQESSWQDAQVKLERNEDLRDLLQPVDWQLSQTQFSQPLSQPQFSQSQFSRTQLLTQLPLQTQNGPALLVRLAPVAPTLVPAPLRTAAAAPASVPSSSPPGSSLDSSLAALHRMLALPNPPPTSTRALVVGSFPSDLTMLCTKQYSDTDGDLVLSDPQVRPLVLYITDSTDRVLSSTSSLAVHVPRDEVVAFCGCKFPEQLYTRLGGVAERFRKRSNAWVHLDLEAAVVDGQTVWTTKTLFDEMF